MSLPKQRGQTSFFDIPYLLDDDFFRRDEPYPLFREKILAALRRVQPELDSLYCEGNGRPAVDPVIVAGATLLQFLERKPDRQAASEVRLNVGWKYALGLALDDTGFHSTTLHNFRDRLVENEKITLIFDAVLNELVDSGLVRKKSKQRLDSTHVVGHIKAMSRLEIVRETLRLCLQVIEKSEEHESWEEWATFKNRYLETPIDWLHEEKDVLESKFIQAGYDAQTLIAWLDGQCEEIKDHAQSDLLRRVFKEQFDIVEADEQAAGELVNEGGRADSPSESTSHLPEEKPELQKEHEAQQDTVSSPSVTRSANDRCAQASRDGEATPPELVKRYKSPGCVVNPHDPDCQWSAKGPNGSKPWQGYKAQIAETLSDDATPKTDGEPTDQFVVDITTTMAIVSDFEGMTQTLEAQEERGFEPPSELYVDTGYVSDDSLHEQQERGTNLVGPARQAPQHFKGYAADRFNVLNNKGYAVCPAGKKSVHRCLIDDSSSKDAYYRYEWGRHCDQCQQQKQCNNRKNGRRELVVGLHHDLLQARRIEMQTKEFKKRMNQRAGVEGTVSECKRGYGLGRTRYRGLENTTLANYMIGAAVNVHRWFARLLWEDKKNAQNN